MLLVWGGVAAAGVHDNFHVVTSKNVYEAVLFQAGLFPSIYYLSPTKEKGTQMAFLQLLSRRQFKYPAPLSP